MSAVHSELQKRIDELEVLPATVTVALRCIELGKNREAGIEEYAELIQADAALSGKILAVTNSSFFGVRRKAVTVKQAVGLLGTECVRALAVSYCLAGLHNTWQLDAEDARAYWEASLCKAIAARLVAQTTDRLRADEAFTMGLFQDIGIGLFVATAGQEYGALLRRSDITVDEQLSHEQARFGLNHASGGHLISQRLSLPESYADAIRFHHQRAELAAAVGDAALATAVHVAALLPHDIRAWQADTMLPLDEMLRRELSARWPDAAAFVRDVQAQLEELIGMFSLGAAQAPSLVELIQEACVENVRNTASLALYAHALKERNTQLTSDVDDLTAEQQAAAHRAAHDPLTGVLNRDAFLKRSADALAQAGRAGRSAAIAVFDLDNFQRVNEAHGRACGDAVLQAVAQRLRQALQGHVLVGRWGGDELAVLLEDVAEQDCLPTAQRVQRAIEQTPITWRGVQVRVTVSAGVRWTARPGQVEVQPFVEAADQALYQAKVLYGHGVVLATDTELVNEPEA